MLFKRTPVTISTKARYVGSREVAEAIDGIPRNAKREPINVVRWAFGLGVPLVYAFAWASVNVFPHIRAWEAQHIWSLLT